MVDKLSSLRAVSTIVADTGDISAVTRYQPQDATTNMSLILSAVRSSVYNHLIHSSIMWARAQSYNKEKQAAYAVEYVAVQLGVEILQYVHGCVSTAIDARFAYDTENSILQARRLVTLYNDHDIPNERILIKIPATWQGICAAAQLEQEGIRCNLTLLFSFSQARACAEAGVFLISPFIGRILDWYQANTAIKKYTSITDPGVLFGRKIYTYYKQYGYKTAVMCASFRNTDEIIALAGCDRLTISPKFLKELSETKGYITRTLFYNGVRQDQPKPITEGEFLWQHHQDPMAVEKLAEGIRHFNIDQRKLEKMLFDLI
ncbi:Transaldolase B [Candidatus Erwinia haradaeae]|uniref:Transaldolase n=1 Tax=Candidatus Erwinia haradaeae TaxID=1922217 RepID=A0A451DDB0_9GAMM|nr:transaldolase [Candidatus Erwinia haradaeae]VFP84423.1 Transaldolase B [Candidatus Erwinia haradaeae]